MDNIIPVENNNLEQISEYIFQMNSNPLPEISSLNKSFILR